ncbi:molybdopterin cofactor-binding domain-containing protein [Caenimonas terrae]|uniref:Molybdopterin cofactor-binding domain-containing protein n=1 Tax=Caenimonas terrae TaxID=696074 RepID=A0ABW0NA54_9BURK
MKAPTAIGAGIRRRSVLAGGGALVLAFAWRPSGWAADAPATAPALPALPASLKKQPFLDGWIRIDAGGKVTVFSGKAELGQGIKTALLQVAAEELQVEPQRIGMVMADTAQTADEGYTAGSHSMQDSGTAIRHAAAQVRALLVGLAAQRLNVPADQLVVQDGVVKAAGGAGVSYGELVSGELLHVQAQPQPVLRDPAQHTIVGKPMPRLDIPAKVAGGVAYVQDLRLPGMVHARVLRPPSPAATLRSLDAAAVEKLPGVLKVVRDGSFVAVIAQKEYQSIVALRALAAAAQWDERETLPAQAGLYPFVRGLASQDIVILDRGSQAAAGDKQHSAGYLRPYQLHASIGPSCAVAQFTDGAYTVWTHSQGVFPLRRALAELLAQPEASIRCIHTEGSGCYGHNAADDVAADAALLARALPGKPVRVQWMREDEHTWEPFGPPMVTGVTASLDAAGRIAQWDYGVWSNTHNARPGAAGDLLAARHLATPFAPSPPKPGAQPEGAGDRNAIPLYTLPNARVTHHFLPEMPLRVSALRGLGAYMNVFSIESFMDELARAAGADPVAFRLKHLDDPRAQEVIRLAADRFGWNAYQRRAGHGRGFAFARYKNLAAYAAMACEVEVRRDTGEVKLLRVVCAVDSGEAVNPDGIRNQIEGGIVQSSSWTLSEEVTFDRTRVTSRDWGGYPILRFAQVPQAIEVHIVGRPGLPFLGTGEAAQGPTSALIANALADATGVRIRQLPLSRERVRAALLA